MAIREITDLNFALCGDKPKNFKSYIKKTERFYNKRKIKKLDSPPVLISCNHILYDVYGIKRKYKDLFDDPEGSEQSVNLIQRFSLDELYCAMEFYGYKFINTPIRPATAEWVGLNNYLREPFNVSIPPALNKYLNLTPERLNLWLVYLTGDNTKDCDSLSKVEQTDDIVYYFYEGNKPSILKDINYTTFVKNKDNIPSLKYGNLVDSKEWVDAMWYTNQVNWVGEWTKENMDWVLNQR